MADGALPGAGKLQVFSAGESVWQRRFATWRQQTLAPICRVLTWLGVSADIVSLLGVAAGLLVPLGLLRQEPGWIVLAYALHLFCDGLDGPLARHQDRASARGGYLDLVADHALLVLTAAALLALRPIAPFWALLYTVSYLLVVVHAAILNTLGAPPRLPILRSKYLLFALVLAVEYGAVAFPWLDQFFLLFASYDTVMAVVLMAAVWRRLPGPPARMASAADLSPASAAEVIAAFGLQPLPGEGGYFRETYRSSVPAAGPAAHDTQPRAAGTAIYYLLTADTYSALHRLRADEVYHFYLGDPVCLSTFTEPSSTAPAPEWREFVLGCDWAAGQQLQHTVPAGTWQGSRLLPGGRWALLGTTVCPGFEFADFELATAADLARFGLDAERGRSLLAGRE